MMREWATVVSWERGIATLHSESKTSCSRCSAKAGCGSMMLNKLGPKNAHVMRVAIEQPLKPGQRIELGIQETSLLSSAFLVYMTPLFGLFIVAGVFQHLFQSDMAAAGGALIGGIGGVILAKALSRRLGDKAAFQPKILNVALPQHELRVETVDSA